MINKIKDKLRPFVRLLRLAKNEFIARNSVSLPTVINFNANDICNSKCTMCNIWQQKQENEITPTQFYNLLKDPLYKNIKHIGITGGEPTIREDLPELYEAAIKAIPDIHGLSIITNAIQEKTVIERIEQVMEVCLKYNKQFSMMVSLDGYKEVHDKVRGREGNFETAINVINHFTQKGINLAIGSTISKVNVWEIEELLTFLKEHDIYGRFRVAEFIKRLYNEDRFDVIRNFDEDEKYQLCLFFYKLINTYEKNPTYQRTYKSIINILTGGKRLIGCPYHKNGLVVNSKGELAYCAPKSKIIGNGKNFSSLELFKKNLSERERILNENCDSCIHDYHHEITFKEKLNEYKQVFWKRQLRIENNIKYISSIIPSLKKRNNNKTIFIVGWYGTETVGDKAILGGIIHELKIKYGDINLYIGSLIPFITKKTIRELNMDAIIIDDYSIDFFQVAKSSDIIIMGGGPLMDLDELAIPLKAFEIGKKYNKENIIYGCGLGPLTDEKYIDAVKKILNLSSVVKVRDYKSLLLAKSWTNSDIEISLSGDPSKIYLKRFIRENLHPKSKSIRCFLREWTYEYSRDISYEEFLELKKRFEVALANLIKAKAIELNVEEIILEHMHNFVIGNDDRDFSRYFIKEYFQDFAIPIRYNKYLSTVESITKSMQSSSHNICMRFHSVVFAHTLSTEFTAVDYTKGGKILNYLKDNQNESNYLSVDILIGNYYENSPH